MCLLSYVVFSTSMSMLRSLALITFCAMGSSPRLYTAPIHPVSLLTQGVAIVIRIPRSWAAPHVVDYQGHWRFYSRNSSGKYPLDIEQVRTSFALTETIGERIRNFRAERLERIVAGETPVLLEGHARTVLYIVSIGAFDPAVRFHVAGLANQQVSPYLAPINSSGWNLRHNFDGFLTYTLTVRSFFEGFPKLC